MAPRVGLIGATGETGRSILNGLLEAGTFDIVALTRPSSLAKPANQALPSQGIELRAIDLKGPHAEIVQALDGIEILISAVGPNDQLDQIPLVDAAHEAGVKRFLPCAFVTVMVGGVGLHLLRDLKEQVYNHIKLVGLPYTIVDVGWWYQIYLPRLPSGRLDYALIFPHTTQPGDGTVPSATTDLRDIGRYVARIIVDPRTLNRYVFVYNELLTPEASWRLLESLAGEALPRAYT
ncbi:Isoflavone reductase family protein, partial [Teratosphaeria destructans]